VLACPGDLEIAGRLWCWLPRSCRVPGRRAAAGQAGAPAAVGARQGAGRGRRAWRAQAVADDR